MDVIDYCREEVSRQGHDIYSLDGIERVGWMLDAWVMAMHPEWVLSRDNIEDLGRLVERYKNKDGFRTCGVRVGGRVCPPHEEMKRRIDGLLRMEKSLRMRSGLVRNDPPMAPLEFYREFELIHPFVDGNGRTGKILLNWLNKTMLQPIFPPNDFWGKPIENP